MQNEDAFLKCQFSARYYYNRAEYMNYFVWLSCIAAALTIFIPDTNNWILLGLPLLFDVAGCIFEKLLDINVTTAARLRNYFDAYVLDINKSRYSDEDIRGIKEIVDKIASKHSKECSIQISHTGNDSPPGVRNWYEFSHEFSDTDVQFECQRQNCWWNKQVSKRRIAIYIVISVILLAMIIIAWRYFNAGENLLRIALCSGILLKVVERVCANIKYYHQSLKIDGASELVDGCKDEKNIWKLQTMIDARREMPVLEINAFHKRIANKLSARYRRIS